jgi:hypothetical protein
MPWSGGKKRDDAEGSRENQSPFNNPAPAGGIRREGAGQGPRFREARGQSLAVHLRKFETAGNDTDVERDRRLVLHVAGCAEDDTSLRMKGFPNECGCRHERDHLPRRALPETIAFRTGIARRGRNAPVTK